MVSSALARAAQTLADGLRTTNINPALVTSRLEENVTRIYGTWEAYEQTKQIVGIAPDHAANFERAGVILQPKQLMFAVACRNPLLREIGMGGAKGPGKSFVMFAQMALDDCQRYPGVKLLYLRKIAKSAKEQLHDLVLAVLGYFADKEVIADRITFGNGSRIIIGGFKDDNEALKYAGVENDGLGTEEATQLSNRTHQTIRLSLRSSKLFDGVPYQPKEYLSANPLGIGHVWFKQRFVDNERFATTDSARHVASRKFIFSTVYDNVMVNPEYIANLKELTGAERRAFLDGDWDVSAGAYFENWHYNTHVIRPINDVSWMRELWCSMDYGFNHWNICYLHGQDGDGNFYTLDELAHRKQHPHQIAPDIHAWLGRYSLTRSDLAYFLVGTDVFQKTGAAAMTVAEQYQRHGIYVSGADTSPGSRTAGAHHIASLLGDRDNGIPPRWFVTTRCPKLIETIPYLERNPNNAEDVRKVDADDQGRGGDDPYDAVRYGLWKPHVSRIS